MKTYNHLMDTYLSKDNYLEAVKNATKHKGSKNKKRRQAAYFKNNAEKEMPAMLVYAKDYKNASHRPIQIYDGIRRKKRIIIVPTIREQIVHHMVVNVMKPIFMKSMYEHSYGSIPGRGAHLAKRRIEKWIKTGKKDIKYCLKMDIRKYFDSVPHSILKAKLAKIIHDADFLTVLYTIIDASPNGIGIPIGFYTSQWFANWYLTELDHYIKEQLCAKYYIRYMDDMVIFGSNKRKLHRIRIEIERFLNEKLGLKMKDNWQVFLFDYVTKECKHKGRDLDFMGFRIFRNRTILRKSLMLKACRKAKRISKKVIKTVYDCRQMISYLGWFNCTATYNAYKKRIKPYVNFRSLKRRIGAYQRRMNKCGIQQKIATT